MNYTRSHWSDPKGTPAPTRSPKRGQLVGRCCREVGILGLGGLEDFGGIVHRVGLSQRRGRADGTPGTVG